MRILVDEMFTPALAERLRGLGHDAASIHDGWMGIGDDEVFALAVTESRVLVTEDVGGFS